MAETRFQNGLKFFSRFVHYIPDAQKVKNPGHKIKKFFSASLQNGGDVLK